MVYLIILVYTKLQCFLALLYEFSESAFTKLQCDFGRTYSCMYICYAFLYKAAMFFEIIQKRTILKARYTFSHYFIALLYNYPVQNCNEVVRTYILARLLLALLYGSVAIFGEKKSEPFRGFHHFVPVKT